MPNKTDLHELIEELEQTIVEHNNFISIVTKERDVIQVKADKLFEELDTLKQNSACISIGLIRYVLEDMVEQLPDKPNRFDFHKWASTIAQEIMIDQTKDTRIEVDSLFIEPADLRIEYPIGDHDA